LRAFLFSADRHKNCRMSEKAPADNPHMWIPYHGPEPYDEVCHLCGTFSGAQTDRAQLRRLLDRLARSTQEICTS
jgi:hypothetical protein